MERGNTRMEQAVLAVATNGCCSPGLDRVGEGKKEGWQTEKRGMENSNGKCGKGGKHKSGSGIHKAAGFPKRRYSSSSACQPRPHASTSVRRACACDRQRKTKQQKYLRIPTSSIGSVSWALSDMILTVLGGLQPFSPGEGALLTRLAVDWAAFPQRRSYHEVLWGAVQPHNNFWGLHTNIDVFSSRVGTCFASPPRYYVSVSRFTFHNFTRIIRGRRLNNAAQVFSP